MHQDELLSLMSKLRSDKKPWFLSKHGSHSLIEHSTAKTELGAILTTQAVRSNKLANFE
jgi:hypothetical protein